MTDTSVPFPRISDVLIFEIRARAEDRKSKIASPALNAGRTQTAENLDLQNIESQHESYLGHCLGPLKAFVKQSASMDRSGTVQVQALTSFRGGIRDPRNHRLREAETCSIFS